MKYAKKNIRKNKTQKQLKKELTLPNIKTNYLNSFKRKDQSVDYKQKLMQEFEQIQNNLCHKENSPDRLDLKLRFHKIDKMYIPDSINYDNRYFDTMKQKLKFI